MILIIFILLTGMGKMMARDDIRGSLVIVGGRLEDKEIYKKFITLAEKYRNKKTDEIKIGIMPAGSADPIKSGKAYKKDFISYGVSEKNIEIIPLAVKDDKSTDFDESTWKDNGWNREIAERIKDYDAIWFVGGDQSRYTKVLIDEKGGHSYVLDAIWEIYKKGAVLGGSSAGAAIMSDPMICGGTSLGALNFGITCEDTSDKKGDPRVFLTEGLGFFKFGMVDQHFNQRGRLGRLIVAVCETKNNIAFGIDENTALVVDNSSKTVQVIGEGGLTIVNLKKAVKDISKTRMAMNNIIISYIEKGDTYNLNTGEFEIRKTDDLDKEEYEEKSFVSTSIFDNIKDAITVHLSDFKETKGMAFEMTGDTEGEGFILKFKKEEDTKIFCGSKGFAAINVHMDIVPVKVKVE
ncbi:MAG TPA: cyanophycinase [Candidatus Eremiobacteraeota bacterium]|nr:cyanophycinase [Candidatus Eremiobacteraeota bacterium]